MQKLKKSKGISKWSTGDKITLTLMMLPFLAVFILFMIVPVFSSLVLSFFKYDMINAPKFSGLENYFRMFIADKVFMISLKNTLMFAVRTFTCLLHISDDEGEYLLYRFGMQTGVHDESAVCQSLMGYEHAKPLTVVVIYLICWQRGYEIIIAVIEEQRVVSEPLAMVVHILPEEEESGVTGVTDERVPCLLVMVCISPYIHHSRRYSRLQCSVQKPAPCIRLPKRSLRVFAIRLV